MKFEYFIPMRTVYSWIRTLPFLRILSTILMQWLWEPLATKWSALCPRPSTAFTLQPLFSRYSAISKRPSSSANSRGVLPDPSVQSILAPVKCNNFQSRSTLIKIDLGSTAVTLTCNHIYAMSMLHILLWKFLWKYPWTKHSTCSNPNMSIYNTL